MTQHSSTVAGLMSLLAVADNALRDYERFIEISKNKETVKQIRSHVREMKHKKI